MTKEIDQKQILEIIEKLPEEVKEILFSEKTADTIFNICNKYGVALEKITLVAKYAGRVVLGILPREKLSETLKDEAGLSQKTANSVADEIALNIFSQLGLPTKPTPPTPPTPPTSVAPPSTAPKKPSSQDTYHEPIV